MLRQRTRADGSRILARGFPTLKSSGSALITCHRSGNGFPRSSEIILVNSREPVQQFSTVVLPNGQHGLPTQSVTRRMRRCQKHSFRSRYNRDAPMAPNPRPAKALTIGARRPIIEVTGVHGVHWDFIPPLFTFYYNNLLQAQPREKVRGTQ